MWYGKPVSSVWLRSRKPRARIEGVLEGTKNTLKFWKHPLGICKISNTNMLYQHDKHLPHLIPATCSVCWTAVVGHNSFSKLYVCAICFVHCYDMIYLLTAIWLSPGGSSTVHIYTQTLHRTIRNKQYIEQHNNFGRVRAVPRLGLPHESLSRKSLQMVLTYFWYSVDASYSTYFHIVIPYNIQHLSFCVVPALGETHVCVIYEMFLRLRPIF